jgi:hypothetical protein
MNFGPSAAGSIADVGAVGCGAERSRGHHSCRANPDGKIDGEVSIREILGVGSSFEFDILGRQDWTGRRMVADRFRDRRVFLCGDAAHIWVAFCGLRHECGDRRRDEPVVDAGGRDQRVG